MTDAERLTADTEVQRWAELFAAAVEAQDFRRADRVAALVLLSESARE